MKGSKSYLGRGQNAKPLIYLVSAQDENIQGDRKRNVVRKRVTIRSQKKQIEGSLARQALTSRVKALGEQADRLQ